MLFRRRIQREVIILGLGDLAAFILALWLSLLARYFAWPSWELFSSHLGPFSIIFLFWLLIFFIADLYNRRPIFHRERLINRVANAQLINSFLALTFFYLIPYFGITPKITLFIDLLLSLFLVVWWRVAVSRFVYRRRKENYLFLCHGPEVNELKQVFKQNSHYQINVVEEAPPPALWRRRRIGVAVINAYANAWPRLEPNFYRLMFTGIRFVSVHELYEEIFGRIPLSAIDERWLATNARGDDGSIYRLIKRLADIVLGVALLILSLPFYPLIWLAIRLDDGGPLFFHEERVGRFGEIFKIRKFRSMTLEADIEKRQVTAVGKILRRSRLDELPQLPSVIFGFQSLIGPRPERPKYVQVYEREIPCYQARHLVRPGLSGWAQLYHERHPHFRLAAAETKEKLSYDLYYVKNRGLWLDLKIALKTIRTLLSRTGR